MADASVTATGLTELRRAINQLPRAVELALRNVAWHSSRRIMARAKQLVPVDTGYTRDHIHIIEDVEHKQYIVSDGSDAPLVRIALHRSKRTGRIHTQKVTLNMLPNWLEFGTRTMRARPFMRPAADAEEARYKAEMRQAAQDALKTVADE